MKKYLAIILLPLVFVGLGWRDHRRLAALRENELLLAAQLTTLGLPADAGTATPRITKRLRSERPDPTTAVFQEIRSLPADGSGSDSFGKHLRELGSGDLKRLAERVLQATELPPAIRLDVLRKCTEQLASEDPAASLSLFSRAATAENARQLANLSLNTALSLLAKTDPAAAFAWLQENLAKYPAEFDANTSAAFIKGTAAADPKLAFQYFDQLLAAGLAENIMPEYGDDPFAGPGVSGTIVGMARTDEERTATLAALRERIAGLPPDSTERESLLSEMGNFGPALVDAGYEAAEKWISAAHLSREEKQNIAQNIALNLLHGMKDADCPKWVDWICRSFPEVNTGSLVGEAASIWAKKDYVAAEHWLSGYPEGADKVGAISVYAQNIADKKPDLALKWAKTLPPGKDRQDAFSELAEAIPNDTPEHREVMAEIEANRGALPVSPHAPH